MIEQPRLIVSPHELAELRGAQRLRLFLDYDGTLAEFAPTPDHVLPDPELIELVARLAQHPRRRVAVISGRRLAHIQKLLPVPGVLLAGSYGLELQLEDGEQQHRLLFDEVRGPLEAVRPVWEGLLAGRKDFYLEDKGWSLAIHARYAADRESEAVLEQARPLARQAADLEQFRFLGGHKFLEICPQQASKAGTLAYLLERQPWPGAFLLNLGDDDKDEEAFQFVQRLGGLGLVAAAEPRPSYAKGWLAGPAAVRRFLQELAGHYPS